MRRPRQRTFRKTRRPVSWLTHESQQVGSLLTVNENQMFLLGTNADNDFVQNHPKFAKRNDIIALKRIVGRLRLAMYLNDAAEYPFTAVDATIAYGICIVKGDYDDSGVWTPPDVTLIPNPVETSDQDEKWLFLDRCILSPGVNVITVNSATGPLGSTPNAGFAMLSTGTSAAEELFTRSQPIRSAMMSNDTLLPNGSWIDLSTRRKLEYAEKLAIIVNLIYAGPADQVDFYVEPFLRILVGG